MLISVSFSEKFQMNKMAFPPETELKSTFPAPPSQYINLFTDENVRRGRVLKPPPPIHTEYTMFGAQFNADDTIIRPLETQVNCFNLKFFFFKFYNNQVH